MFICSKTKAHKYDNCEKKFPCPSKLRNHIKNVHEGQRNYPCSFCEKAFFESGSLRKHMSIHAKDVRKFLIQFHILF